MVVCLWLHAQTNALSYINASCVMLGKTVQKKLVFLPRITPGGERCLCCTGITYVRGNGREERRISGEAWMRR